MTKREQLAAVLAEDGWSEQDIESAFGQSIKAMTRERVVRTLRILGGYKPMRMKIMDAWLEGARERRERARSLSAQE